MGEVLYFLLCVFLFIGVIISKKERFNAEVNYHRMRLSLEESQKKQAQEQISHSRYGK